jgi:serine/threonine protein kinase
VAIKIEEKRDNFVWENCETWRYDILQYPDLFSRIRSSNCIYLFAWCSGPKCCIVEEYMSRGSLHQIMTENSISIGWKEFFQYSISIAEAIDYLHSLDGGIVLGYLTSSHVLVQSISGNKNLR